MTKVYLTPTLLNNWHYYIHCPETEEENAKQDFLNCLNKIKTEPTPKMLRGLKFEEDVYNFSKNIISADDDTVAQIADIIKDGLYQESVKEYLTDFKNYEVWVYGICDFIKANTIYDVKRVDKYDIGKYLHSFQHLIYLYSTNTECFKYLISDGAEVYEEDYHKSPLLDKKLLSGALDFLNWLDINSFLDIYFEKWQFTKKD